MKIYTQSDNEWFGRFSEDSELKESILELAKEKGVESGYFTIIGAVKNSRFSYYDQTQKQYREMRLDEHAEILNCTGNISLLEGKPFIHAHITFADSEGRSYGGHLVGARIFAAEIYLKKFPNSLEREPDESTGLQLLK
ncbi:MAG: DNA-binding protein [archaeon]|jgi:hypothetical protein|nr:DNA-binding protein [Euryarchaeota archaeon]MDP6704554.1 DNA-binding protein [archaeon]HIK01212.1 DNA-binding protein [Candidatus Undinarchaeales archaeon ERR594346 U_76725]|tara:strand:- start:33100 stop:33516 length:417 start_codon:yes stop_codon:yes gene_type:complete